MGGIRVKGQGSHISLNGLDSEGATGVSQFECRSTMVLHAHRLMILVVLLVGSLAVQPEKASGLRSIGIVLGWSDEPRAAGKSRHALEDVELDVNVDVQLAPAPLSFDLNWTSKRRVPRGSDPIHNRC